MADFKLSHLAFEDLKDIAKYTRHNYGAAQSQKYRASLKASCEALSQHPSLGHEATVAQGLRAFDHQFHTIYYVPTDKGVLIVRILHQSMDARRHLT
ncbi:type II toxin-antitoxin system RelE/ParE family toxin [Asticcacaulis endophyticus]|uniref:Toxin n=1 Tax=Asticcacaulis endophyticus TaxID=1395890 RepID=A0A918URD6_9CAUL|nr:type II toxin-antitoxin system RelE/ParE family toxin [Asticcacaulis endophyticus]GGZ28753.1 plasmid stabilization protein [Asticcacaulis endophyticus]